MQELAHTFLLVYAALFPIVNPIGSAPIFLSMTGGMTHDERTSLVGHIAFNSFLLLLGSLFVGSHVLEFFGITLPVVRIAGGLVVAATGWNLLQADPDGDEEQTAHKPKHPTTAFYPLTMPITVGPGSIAVAITLGSQRPRVADLTELAILGAAAFAGIVAITVTIFLCYRFAETTIGVLGQIGTDVLVRLSAFILFCIGIEIIWNGYSSLMHIAT